MAGFEVITYGRFWVIAEGITPSCANPTMPLIESATAPTHMNPQHRIIPSLQTPRSILPASTPTRH
jgi:hypothetical protein